VSSHRNRDLIVATMKSNGFDREATATALGCCGSTVTRQMHMAAAAEGKTYINQRGRGGRAKGKTPVRNFVLAERAAGRSCGRYRVKGVQISKPIPSNAKCHPLTEADKAVMAAVIEHMGDELAGVTF
jgi:hypothetical protein